MNRADIEMIEPPKIDGISEAMEQEFLRMSLQIEAACDRAEEKMIDAGMPIVAAVSATAHAMMNALARQAHVTAVLDGRPANREWFLHNCAAAFDRWSSAQKRATSE